jgi:hypothetical protein
MHGNDKVITQKKYSIYFHIALILITLFGILAFYVLFTSSWDQVIVPNDSFGALLGRRVLMARMLAIILMLFAFVFSLFYSELFGRFLLFAAVWSWISYIDDVIVFEQGVLQANEMAGGFLVMFRPLYLLLITYLGIEHWVRYGDKFE